MGSLGDSHYGPMLDPAGTFDLDRNKSEHQSSDFEPSIPIKVREDRCPINWETITEQVTLVVLRA